MAHNKSIPLYFDQFENDEQPFGTYDQIGEDVRLAFDPNSRMAVTCQRSQYQDHTGSKCDALILRGTNRGENDWMALEIDLDLNFKNVILFLRYAPAERVYPRAYIKVDGRDEQIDLPDFTIGFDWTKHDISGEVFDHFSGLKRSDITALRIALLFPNRPWFALGVSKITQEIN